jgi:hypothetical protein
VNWQGPGSPAQSEFVHSPTNRLRINAGFNQVPKQQIHRVKTRLSRDLDGLAGREPKTDSPCVP